MTVWTEISRARFLTLCAVVAMYACSLAAARQSSTGDAAATKPTTTTSNAQGHSTASGQSSSSAGDQKSTAKTHTASVGKRPSRKKSARVRGQQKIDSERAQAIQEALIREHYLTGEATGTWNQSSEEAMRRYQADNGWQSKTVPDSRALIKLGLGPSKDHLLNPDSAMTTVPDAPRAEPMATTSHSAAPTTDSAPVAAPSPTQTDSSHPQ
ncbi:MAG TPA: peptidoglycan-binding domain-containing protein [Candidatus Sulfotelmatobacter sp.]